ncbi:MAG: MarR family transcriptional regulator, and catechol-resistance regulon repressor [Bacillota bacterium]|nr:MarR family transcriptional regulator, and catechol-resistance regulon repressor [Bacillota bacterium]
MAQSYNWVEEMASRTIVEIKRTHEMLEEVFNNHFRKYGISDAKFNVLVILYKNPEKCMMLSEIGEEMLVTKANITGLIDRLERQGFVRRIRDETDRRKIKAAMTEKGKRFTEEIIERYKEWSARMVRVLSDGEKSQLIDIMGKLQRGLIEG